jgi:hypothetical protein
MRACTLAVTIALALACAAPVRAEERPEPDDGHGSGRLVAGGYALMAMGYDAALATGAAALVGSPNPLTTVAGATLFIPVAGPFVSALVVRQSWWSVPWALVDGAAQVSGLAMVIVGFRTRVGHAPRAGASVRLLPLAAPGTAGLVAVGRF